MNKSVLLISSGWVHPTWRARKELRRLIDRRAALDLQEVSSMDDLLGLNLSQFAGMVLYFHSQVVSTTALDAFESFMAGGGGVLAVHSATASFKKISRYFDILGGRFIGHGPVQPFEISPSLPEDEIFPGAKTFLVKDELYLHEQCADIRVHFHSELRGERVPVVWTRQYEQGRVCYACPGHRCPAMESAPYREILVRGLEWVCGIGDAEPKEAEQG